MNAAVAEIHDALSELQGIGKREKGIGKDGRIEIENESPRMTGGVREVVDDVQ